MIPRHSENYSFLRISPGLTASQNVRVQGRDEDATRIYARALAIRYGAPGPEPPEMKRARETENISLTLGNVFH